MVPVALLKDILGTVHGHLNPDRLRGPAIMQIRKTGSVANEFAHHSLLIRSPGPADRISRCSNDAGRNTRINTKRA